MVHGQQDPTVAHSSTLGGGLRSQGAEGAAWRRMAGHDPAETLSRMLLLPYFAVAILLVTAAAITLFAQLNRRRQDRSRRKLSQRYKIERTLQTIARYTMPLRKMCVRLSCCSVKFKFGQDVDRRNSSVTEEQQRSKANIYH